MKAKPPQPGAPSTRPDQARPASGRKAAREREQRNAEDALVDRESEESFPASDPPGWTLGPDKD